MSIKPSKPSKPPNSTTQNHNPKTTMAQTQVHHAPDPQPDRILPTTVSEGRPERRRDEEPRPIVLSGRVEEYREGCLKLEKARHSRVYEAERRVLYAENAVLATYQRTVLAILEELDAAKRTRLMKALSDNAEKTRQVEELRYGICKDDVPGTWQRRHEMSLRGRNHTDREDDLLEDKPRRRKDSKQKVKVHVELEEAQVILDLAEMRGEKTPREDQPERKSKKRK